ncbi:hypothetical protein [Algoriphagus mannitolivorans]|uniref:hypothetical protein n=1 Tax=Algoriphagus mannitolivorans TaxID=226504 RepID=UPI0012F90364|nr:hypothetical protein [Algoriphagus mannitolivorans]
MALAGLILSACSQMATFEEADLMNEQAVAKNGFNLNPFGLGNENARTYSATDCGNFCIDPANPEYSVQTSTISNNSGPQSRVFTYSVYNTLTGFQLDWSYASSNNAGRKLRITVSGAGFASPKTYTTSQLNGGPVSGSNTFTFDASWAACGVVTIAAEILDGDNAVVSGPISTNYSLIGECVVGCDESFSYEVDGNEVTFTYVPSADLDNAELVFTFPQSALDGNPLEGWSYDGQTMRKTMDLDACATYTWTVSLSCKPLNNAQNKWTDFKVNDFSKKGSLSNIKCN